MTTPAKATNTPFFKKRWVKILGTLSVLCVGLYFLLIFAAKMYLVDWFENNGADNASIEKLQVNPFIGRVHLAGVNVEAKGKPLLVNSDMVIDIGIYSLFRKNIRVERAKYEGLMIDLQQYDDGRWRFGSFTTEGKSEEKEIESTEEVATAWAFLADRVVLENCTVRFKTPEIDLALEIENAELSRFSTRDGHPAGIFSLQGTLNEKALEINLDTLQIVPDLKIGGNVKVASFNLDEIDAYLQNSLPTFGGDVGLDGKALFVMSDAGGMAVDYDGVIEVQVPDIGSESFKTSANNLKWHGKVRYESPQKGPMLVVTDGKLSASQYKLQLPSTGFENREAGIELTGKTQVEIADNVVVKNDGTLQIQESTLEMAGLQLTEQSMQWKGHVFYDSNHEGGGQYVQTDGDLELGEFVYSGGENDGKIGAGLESLTWIGNIIYSQMDAGANSSVKLDGTLNSGGLFGDLQQQKMKFFQQSLEVVSESTLVFGSETDISGANSIKLENFKMLLGEDTAPLITLDLLKVEELNGKGGQNIDAKELFAENFTFHGVEEGGVEKPVLFLSKTQLSEISWSGAAGIASESLQFENLAAIIVRDKDGNINISQRLAPLSGTGDKDTAGTDNNINAETPEKIEEDDTTVAHNDNQSVGEQEKGGLPIRLGKVVFTGSNNFQYEDYTLAVPYLTELVITKFELGELDSTKPELETPLLFQGELEKRAPVQLEGTISPFREKLAVDVDFSLKNYPLTSLSAYTVQSVGTALASGQLQLTTDLKLADDMINMENNVLLKKLQTEKISEELAKELDNELPIPLDSALSILRDSKDNIDLDIPLNGPISDFSIGISDVLVTALSKAIIPAASGYMMYALGPYGALAYVGMKVGENMLQVNLPPVKFIPGTTTMVDEQDEYLERIARILTDRPETDLQLCPQVASWEFMKDVEIKAIPESQVEVPEKDQAKLDELGQQRGGVVQEYLTTKHSIAKGRLLVCETVIETSKDTEPSLLLHL